MEIQITNDFSFDCPEGKYRATLYSVSDKTKLTKNGPETFLRISFEVTELSTEDTTMLVARNFVPTLKQSGDLKTFLDLWLGESFVKQHKKGGKFDFDLLRNRQADILIRHIENEGYPKPYVHLQAAYPPGSQVKEKTQVLSPTMQLKSTNEISTTTA